MSASSFFTAPRVLAAVGLVLALAACGDDNGVGPGEDSGTPRRIAFETNRDGNFEIYAMNEDGTGVTRLTTDTAIDVLPAWSPDGSIIAFSSSRDRSSPGLDIYLMRADDGTILKRLTNTPGQNGRVAWSRDGRIAFTSTRTDPAHAEIWVMNGDGSDPVQLTHDNAFANVPSWSPDGSRIVFQSDRDGHDQLYVMNADGSGLTRLTNSAGNDQAPAWSPDGSKIAFQSDRDAATLGDSTGVEIYVMNADGTGVTRLTSNSAFDGAPAWSPDGGTIIFDSQRDGNEEVYIMKPDGTGQTNITRASHDDGFARFKP